MGAGSKPAHAVVDGQAVRAVLDNPDADRASGPATAGILSAPPSDPADDALAHVNGAYVTDKAGNTNGTASRAGTDGFGAVLGSGNGGENLRVDGEPFDLAKRPKGVTEALTAGDLLPEMMTISPGALTSQARPVSAAWDASEAVTELYTAHYNQLVRLAVMLVHDVQTAEEIVQDAFEAMHLAWRRLRNTEKALAYLRQTIINRARSVLRHRKVVEMNAPKPAPDEQSAEHAALTLIERSAVTSALRMLPERQREAIVLRYYGDFCEAEIAKAMGISKGAVKSHTARAMAALKLALEQGHDD